MLLILETHLEDQGAYTGVASNGAGEVRVTAQLEFYFSEFIATEVCKKACNRLCRVENHKVCPA